MSDTNSVEATELDISNWNRREHFYFFKNFSEPYFGLTANVHCTALVQHCQNTKESFYLRYLHSILATVNQLEPLKLRLTTNGERVLKYQRIHASVTVSRADNTFGFGFIEFYESFATFAEAANNEITAVKQSTALFSEKLIAANADQPDTVENMLAKERQDVIHFSALPWLHFTGLSHARHSLQANGSHASEPKVSVGKYIKKDGHYELPIALHLHHALADGYHAACFYEALSAAFNEF